MADLEDRVRIGLAIVLFEEEGFLRSANAPEQPAAFPVGNGESGLSMRLAAMAMRTVNPWQRRPSREAAGHGESGHDGR